MHFTNTFYLFFLNLSSCFIKFSDESLCELGVVITSIKFDSVSRLNLGLPKTVYCLAAESFILLYCYCFMLLEPLFCVVLSTRAFNWLQQNNLFRKIGTWIDPFFSFFVSFINLIFILISRKILKILKFLILKFLKISDPKNKHCR